MDHYKTVVIDYLQSDKAVFVNIDCRLEFDQAVSSDKSRRHCSCDAVAIDMRHGAVYLCDAVLDDRLPSLIRKLSAWTRNWDSIVSAFRRECKVPADWRLHVWLFVLRDSIETLEQRLEQLRQTVGTRFKVKLTALEDVQPWRISQWERHEEDWETNEDKLLTSSSRSQSGTFVR